MEKFLEREFSNESPMKLQKLEEANRWTEGLTDKLGKGVDEGIKKAISLLRAMNFNTSSSCAGHTGEEDRFALPYIEFYTPAPEGWKTDKKKEEKWEKANKEQRQKLTPIFEQFRTNNPELSKLLVLEKIGALGGFRLECSIGTKPTSKEDAVMQIKLRQKAMQAFTEFLMQEYLK